MSRLNATIEQAAAERAALRDAKCRGYAEAVEECAVQAEICLGDALKPEDARCIPACIRRLQSVHTEVRSKVPSMKDDAAEIAAYAREIFADKGQNLPPHIRNLIGTLANRLEKRIAREALDEGTTA